MDFYNKILIFIISLMFISGTKEINLYVKNYIKVSQIRAVFYVTIIIRKNITNRLRLLMLYNTIQETVLGLMQKLCCS